MNSTHLIARSAVTDIYQAASRAGLELSYVAIHTHPHEVAISVQGRDHDGGHLSHHGARALLSELSCDMDDIRRDGTTVQPNVTAHFGHVTLTILTRRLTPLSAVA